MKQERKQWETPQIITYSEDQIIEALGPAQTAASNTCASYTPIGG